jgi:virulence-associated protein VagC
MHTKGTRIFKLGNDLVLRLPSEFRFASGCVYLTRDEAINKVTITRTPGAGAWDHFFQFRDSLNAPAEFMNQRPMNIIEQPSGAFDESEA